MKNLELSQVNGYIAKAIKEQRILHGFSQREIGDYLGISSQQINKYENGNDRVSTENLYKMSLLYKTPVGDFFPPPSQLELSEAEFVSSNRLRIMARMFESIDDDRVKEKIYNLIKSICS